MSNRPKTYKSKHYVHEWAYHDTSGAVIGYVGRYEDGSSKEIVPFFKRNGTGWTIGAPSEPRPLFGLDRLAKQPKDHAVFIVEGEKAAAALHGLNVCAVTSLGGAQAANKSDWTALNGFKNAYILPDNDEPGEHYAQSVYAALQALESPPAFKVLRLSQLPEGGDIVDWVQDWLPAWNGYTVFDESQCEGLREELQAEIKNAEPVPESWNAAALIEWGEPGEIITKTPPVQALTTELIPEPYRVWLADVSYRMQTPPDFATVSALIVTGSLIGAGCGIRPKQRDSWEVIPNVWGGCISPPSTLKTPSMNEAMKLLERVQAEHSKRFEHEQAAAEADEIADQAEYNCFKKQLEKAIEKEEGETKINNLKSKLVEAKKNAKPKKARRLFKTNETSIQAMTVLQNENPRGLLVFRDELTGLLVKWDREDGADERAYFLEGWNGNGSYTDCKIMRGVTDAKNVCISLLGGIQPDKLNRYLYQAMKGHNDGLVQRLQLAVYPDEWQDWQLVDIAPNADEKDRAYSIMQTLADMDFKQHGAMQGEHDDRPFFRFDDDAQAIFNDWLTHLQTVKLKQEDSPIMQEHLSKYRSLMPSLALIFHCIDLADGAKHGGVSATAARLAVQWCEYLESHARRIYAMTNSPEHAAAVRLADKIRAKALPNPFTTRHIQRNDWHGLKDKQEIDTACNLLIDENWLMIVRKPKPATGRPPLPEYHINPVFL